MKLKRITVQNFKPFYGEQHIDFESEPGITLIGAENDRGKTALIEAIRFCLYDFETSRGGRSRGEKQDQCINWTAAQEAAGKTSVTLEFEIDSREYKISRVLQFEKVENREDREAAAHYGLIERLDGDYNLDTRNDDTLEQYDRFISDILPEEASQYFIFNGEKIDDIADRFDEQGGDVRDAIEQVLGLGVLRTTITDLRRYAIDPYEKEFQESKSEAEEYDDLKEKLATERAELEEMETKYEYNQQARERLQALKEELTDQLSDIEEFESKREDLVRRRCRLYGPKEVDDSRKLLGEKEIESMDESVMSQIDNKRNQLQQIHGHFGLLAASKAADHVLDQTQDGTVDAVAEVLSKVSSEDLDECPICEQNLDSCNHSEIEDRLKSMAKDSTPVAESLTALSRGLLNGSATEEDEKIAADGGDISVDAEKVRYDQLCEELGDLLETRGQLLDQEQELEEELDSMDFDNDTANNIRDRRSAYEISINHATTRLKHLKDDIEEQEQKISQIRDDLSDVEGATEREARYRALADLSEETRDTFEKVKSEFVEKRRDSVEKRASAMFSKMTNKPDVYEGLKIEDNYQLKIRTEDGAFHIYDQDPSQGARQIIAYAFIAGLAQFSSRNAPLIIDTPIGRLDTTHKANLIENLSDFVDQVTVLYQPEELSAEDIEKLEEDLIAHYDIVQDGDNPQISRIVDHETGNLRSGGA